jgi:hypothetical protein
MLGVSVLPGVRTLLIRGDEAHPDRQHVSSWDPTTWDAAQGSKREALQDILNTASGTGYLDLLSTPPFGPGVSAGHTRKCPVKDYPSGTALADFDVMLTSWVWLSPATYDALTAPGLVDLFTTYGAALESSLLQTGWNCNESGSYIRSIDSFVPTLLNWQLRSVIGWEGVDCFHVPAIEGLWTDHDEWGLQYAVLAENVDNRRTAASAFPRVDLSETDIPESVWETLGVKALEELNATEAAMRLNAVIDAARAPASGSDAAGGDTETAPELPGLAGIDAW